MIIAIGTIFAGRRPVGLRLPKGSSATALALAYEIASGRYTSPDQLKHDYTRDGVVDRSDAEEIVRALVAVNQPQHYDFDEEPALWHHVLIESRYPLAAYVLRLEAAGETFTAVAPGRTPPFDVTPAYDPDALRGSTLILADFSSAAQQAEAGDVHVALVRTAFDPSVGMSRIRCSDSIGLDKDGQPVPITACVVAAGR